MNSILTVKIADIKPHPNANKLKICNVTTPDLNIEVVCGAKNARKGMITVLAQVGSTTPGGLTIQVSDLRGVQSNGMLCSAKDLGIAEESGIVDLPPDTKLGVAFKELPVSYLSSTPWFNYKEVEAFWEDDKRRIWVYRDGQKPAENNTYQLLSKTYYHEGQYLHRHFA